MLVHQHQFEYDVPQEVVDRLSSKILSTELLAVLVLSDMYLHLKPLSLAHSPPESDLRCCCQTF